MTIEKDHYRKKQNFFGEQLSFNPQLQYKNCEKLFLLFISDFYKNSKQLTSI